MCIRDRLKAENGVYTLKAEETYSYVAVKAGYVTKKDTISVTEDTEKTITMEKAPESTRKDVSAAWKNFRNSDDNMGITSAKTPTSEATTYEKWFKKLGSGWGAAPVSYTHLDVYKRQAYHRKMSAEKGSRITM